MNPDSLRKPSEGIRARGDKAGYVEADWLDAHADAWEAERETSEMHYLRAQTRIEQLEAMIETPEEDYVQWQYGQWAAEAQAQAAAEAEAMAEALVLSHEGHIERLEADNAALRERLSRYQVAFESHYTAGACPDCDELAALASQEVKP